MLIIKFVGFLRCMIAVPVIMRPVPAPALPAHRPCKRGKCGEGDSCRYKADEETIAPVHSRGCVLETLVDSDVRYIPAAQADDVLFIAHAAIALRKAAMVAHCMPAAAHKEPE